MFCPLCECEYRLGFTTCADCGVELVDRLPEQQPDLEPSFVPYAEVLSTFNPMDIALIKSLLDSDKITYFFQGENFTSNLPPLAAAERPICCDEGELMSMDEAKALEGKGAVVQFAVRPKRVEYHREIRFEVRPEGPG